MTLYRLVSVRAERAEASAAGETNSPRARGPANATADLPAGPHELAADNAVTIAELPVPERHSSVVPVELPGTEPQVRAAPVELLDSPAPKERACGEHHKSKDATSKRKIFPNAYDPDLAAKANEERRRKAIIMKVYKGQFQNNMNNKTE